MRIFDIHDDIRGLKRFLVWIVAFVLIEAMLLADEPAGGLSPQVRQALFDGVDTRIPLRHELTRPPLGPIDGNPNQAELGGEAVLSDKENSLLLIEKQMQQLADRLQDLSNNAAMEMDVVERLQRDIVQRITDAMGTMNQTEKQFVASPTGEQVAGQEAGQGAMSSDPPNTSVGDPAQMTPERIEEREAMLWNRLPEKVQTQLRSAAAQPFIRRYEKLIEQFYNRLNETR